MNISVIGTGYVGLVTGAGLANAGNEVLCMDIDERKIEKLKRGESPIYEPGLESLLQRNIKEERLFFTTSIQEAIQFAKVIFIAVGTPPREDGSADLSYVEEVAKTIGQYIKSYKVVVNKSTVPVGSIYLVERIIRQELEKRGENIAFDVVSNPEFLREGAAVKDFLYPDRIIIGSHSSKAIQIMKKIYRPFVINNSEKIIVMDPLSSEMSKYAANCMLATKISFMNEIANICEKVGADVTKVKLGIGSDPRIGPHFINAGLGYGGSCFPKDVKALIHMAKQKGVHPEILLSVESVNQRQRKLFAEKVIRYFQNDLSGKKIAVWGLAFKPETDDMREAASIDVIHMLLEKGATISAFDPKAIESAKKIFQNKINYQADNMYKVLEDADALLILTEWQEFYSPNFEKMKQMMRQPVIFDGRNIFNPEDMKDNEFHYISVGREPL